jgi:predicted kinase
LQKQIENNNKTGGMILIIFGLPGTGKSYFSKHMADEIEAVHLNTDIVRKNIGKQGQYDDNSKKLVYNKLMEEMIAQVQKGRNVILDGTFQKKSARNKFFLAAKQLGQQVHFIEMKANDQTIKERLKSKREYSEADYKIYLQIKSTFEHMDKPHLVLYSDEQNMDDMINKIKNFTYE